MKKLLLALLLLPLSAHAAITRQEAKSAACNFVATCSLTLTNAVSAGDVLLVGVYEYPNGQYQSGPSSVTDTGSDTAQTAIALAYSTGNWGFKGYYFVVGTGGSTFQVTVAFSGSTTYRIAVVRYSGVNNASPLDGSATSVSQGTGTAPAATALTASYAGDQQVAFLISTTNVTVSAWGNSLTQELYVTSASYPTTAIADASIGSTGTVNASATLGGSAPWGMAQLLLRPASGGATCTHAGITSAGAIAVPNGTTGSYRLKNGSLGTPDCSTVSYRQTIGNFGVN